MKNLITILILLISVLGYSQSKSMNGMVIKETTKLENVSIEVTVDSEEEIESSFKLADINEILESSDDNETLSFKIICNGDKMSNGKKSHVSYQVEGNSNEADVFIKNVEFLRIAAIKYYKNKN